VGWAISLPMPGTTGTPLPKKLGIKQGHSVVLLNAPTNFERSLKAGATVKVSHQLRFPSADVVVLFVDSIQDLERRFGEIAERLHPQGGLWVAWRHRSARRITQDVVRRIGLAAGMVGKKACSIDAVWAGMRLVVRPENRDAIAYRMVRPTPQAPRRTRRATTPPRISGAGSAQLRARARSSK
jgi:hypothetical protein